MLILQNVSLFLFFNIKILKNCLEHKHSSIIDYCLNIYSLEVKIFIREPSFPPKSLKQFSFPTQLYETVLITNNMLSQLERGHNILLF